MDLANMNFYVACRFSIFNSMGNFIACHIKDKNRQLQKRDVESLSSKIWSEISNIPKAILENICKNLKFRLDFVLRQFESLFEYFT